MKIKAYPEVHMHGVVSIESEIKKRIKEGDFGIQIAADGRVWICIDGVAFLRFRPLAKTEKEALDG